MSDSLTPWPVAQQAPLSIEFSRQEYWSGLPFPSPGDLPYPGIEPGSPALQPDSLPSEPPGKPRITPKMGASELPTGLQNSPLHTEIARVPKNPIVGGLLLKVREN